MKTLIIISSTYLGNTMKVANAIGEELNGIIKYPEDVLQKDIDTCDLVGIGSGIKFASHDKAIINLIKGLSLNNKKVFIFSTRCRPILGKYHSNLKSCIADKKGILLGEFSCAGFDRTGPWVWMNGYNKNRPNAKDLFDAKLFASQIRKKANPLSTCKTNSPITDMYKGLEVRESVFGRNVMLDTNTCIRCKKCLNICPLNIYSIDNNRALPLEEKECIMCGNCAKNCPTDSIYINETFQNGLKVLLSEGKLIKRYWGK